MLEQKHADTVEEGKSANIRKSISQQAKEDEVDAEENMMKVSKLKRRS